MKEFVVFYAWQSDTPSKGNRRLIRSALDLAANTISEDAAARTQVRIDSDTQGVLGHIGVIDTIIKTILECNAFVPDLTFVAETDGGKQIPNPNVLLEYGYALHVLSDTFLIPVMNTAYGAPEKLPFDMGHRRHPLKYDFPPTASQADWRRIVKQLAADFEAILRPMIQQASSRPEKNPLFQKTAFSASAAFFFPRSSIIGSFGPRSEQQYQFDGEKAIYLRLYPKFRDNQPQLARARLAEFFERRVLGPFSNVSGGITSGNDYGWVNIDPMPNNTTKGITQVFPNGEIWGINSAIFVQYPIQQSIGNNELYTILPMVEFERLCVETCLDYLQFAVSNLERQFPLVVEIGAVGLKGVFISAPTRRVMTQYNFHGPFRVAELIREYEVPDGNRETILDLLRQYFDEVYDHAECVRSKILSDEFVRSQGLPPLAKT